jgi:hypothetical protein
LGSDAHPHTLLLQARPPPHPPQPTVIPQLSGPVPQWVAHQFRSGVQDSPGASAASPASWSALDPVSDTSIVASPPSSPEKPSLLPSFVGPSGTVVPSCDAST